MEAPRLFLSRRACGTVVAMSRGVNTVLVLGAYGLAGRAIVSRLLRETDCFVLAAGRNPGKLAARYAGAASNRLATCVFDAADREALHAACERARVVINAVGPYAKTGAAVAKVVVEAGRPYIDCANEQFHYHRLEALHTLAQERGVPLVTGAGAIPGISTLLAAEMLTAMPGATSVEWYWAQGRHAYAETGLGSMMGGILEVMHGAEAWREGRPQPVVLGRWSRRAELAAPFGERVVLEAPTLDDVVIPARFPVRETHSYFYMGDLPLWMLTVMRLLQPHRRQWAYALVAGVMRRINDRETAKAIAEGVGPESLLQVTVENGSESRTRHMLFTDGAEATAILPVYIAQRIFDGEVGKTGLLTPLEIVDAKTLLAREDGAILRKGE